MREIAALTIERLAQDYSRFFAIEPYLWEFEAMVASGHFQDSIEAPSAFDIVILILWSRLGTHMPERTAVREYRGLDGRTPVTGTEWEFEEAYKAAKDKGAPDLLVYRSLKPAPFDTNNQERFEQQSQQLKALNRFWERHFANQGMFIGAYTSFTSDVEFATALETHLRRLIEKRIEADAAIAQPSAVTWAQAPFRGLESYEFEHAPVFFGQDEAIAKAMLQLVANAENDKPFLVVLGASGSGKSSLVKAGIVPRLFLPRRVPGAAFLRRVTFRPAEANDHEDLFDALARRLTSQATDQDGLPELLQHGQSIASFAAHLRSATTAPAFPIATALGELSAAARRSGRMLDYESAKLVIVVDQLEELFTNKHISPPERGQFIQLLAGLVDSGCVWLIATMRKDFWHRADETPQLVQMAEGPSRLELLPPGLAQFTQIIRRPAEATGVRFEVHPTTNVPLNEVITAEVARDPHALPLLSYLLDQIYRSDVGQGHGHTLTYATYEKLGGLKGAIATQAEAILDRCQPDDRPALMSILYSLVEVGPGTGEEGRAVARRVPLSTFPSGTPQRRIVEAFLDLHARLLVSDAEKDSIPTVRVAHEALISQWPRAQDFVRRNAEALQIRRRIEERYERWLALRLPATKRNVWMRWPRREQGLLSDIDVIDGRRLLKEHGGETDPHLSAYINRSIAHEERTRRLWVGALIVVTGVVSVLAISFDIQRKVAQDEDKIAQRTTHFMVNLFENADPDKSRGASKTVREMLDQGAKSLQSEKELADEPAVRAELLTAMGQAYSGLGLYESAENVLKQARSDMKSATAETRLRTLLVSGTTAFLAGNNAVAAGYLKEAVALARNKRSDPLSALALTGLADVRAAQGHYDEAISLSDEALDINRKLGATHELLEDRSDILDSLGTTYFYKGDLVAAEGPLRQALALREEVFGMNHARTSESLNNLGVLLYQSGRFEEALVEYRLAYPIELRVYGAEHPEIAGLLNNLGRSALMAGRVDEAEPLLRRALSMTEKFEGATHEDLVAPLYSLGMIDAYRGRNQDAQSEFRRAEKIARLPDHGGLLDQVLLNEADLEMTQGAADRAGALLNESNQLLRQNYPDDSGNSWRFAVWNTVNAEALAVAGKQQAAEQLIAAAQLVIIKRFGVGSLYSLLAKRREAFIANSLKTGGSKASGGNN